MLGKNSFQSSNSTDLFNNNYSLLFQEHARWSPICGYLIRVKGYSFIEECRTKSCVRIPNGEKLGDHETSCHSLKGLDDVNFEDITEAENYCSSLISDLACKICFQNKSNVLFFPCKHLSVCAVCSLKIEICPICRAQVASAIKVYLT